MALVTKALLVLAAIQQNEALTFRSIGSDNGARDARGARGALDGFSAANTSSWRSHAAVREISKEKMMESMTLEKAYKIFAKMNISKVDANLSALVEERIGRGVRKSSKSGNDAVDRARVMLNGMMEEAQKKKDISAVSCGEFEIKQIAILKDLELDIAYVNSEASGARSEILRAQEVIQTVEEVKMPTTRQQLVEHNERCGTDQNALKAQLSILNADIEVMKKILSMVCAENAAPQPVPPAQGTGGAFGPKPSFMQGQLLYGGGTVVKCISCMTGQQLAWLRHNQLQSMLSSLKSTVAKRALQEHLLGVFDESARENPKQVRDVVLTQAEMAKELPGVEQQQEVPPPGPCNEELTGENGTDYRGCQDETGKGNKCMAWDSQSPHEHFETSESFPMGGLADNYCRNPTGKTTIWCYTTNPEVPWEYCAPKQQLDAPQGVSKHECVNSNACKLSGPNCNKLRDRFLVILAGMIDNKNKLSDDLNRLENECEDMKVSYENTIKTLESQLKEEQTALAGATKSMTENQQQSAESNGQHIELDTEYHEKMEECCETKNEFMAEICALEKIRGELYRMEGIEMLITDCEVAAWIDEECSVSCGGGTQQRTRSIIAHPANGTACPVLGMERSCSMQGCPIDCKVDPWSQWSECTAECGGGVMQRVRSRTQEPENDGDPCPEMSESKECNVDACNANCVLEDWTDWGICSKACDNGHETRVRKVAEEARGNGICPLPENEFRMDHRVCNDFDCTLLVPQDGSNRTLLECNAMIDIVFMVDGSGSLEEYGWETFKGTVSKVVNAMIGNVTGVNVAVMLFSGPDNGPDLEACTSADPSVTPDVENQCSISWVSPFSTNIAEVSAKVDAMVWPAKTTLTSMAIAEAKAMLVNGRPEASSLVVILTDGKPMSPIKTGQACDDIKQEARLVWIAVGGGVKDAVESMKIWSSKPSQDNVLEIETFASLGTDATLNNIISTVCPAVQ